MDLDTAVQSKSRPERGPTHDVFVIGASAGALDALTTILRELPADFPGSIFIVVHLRAGIESQMAGILDATGSLPVSAPEDMTPIRRGQVYVSTQDRHMLIERGHVRVVRGPKENRHRPAIDPLFRSAAWTYGPRVVGIVLTGYLDDGAAGLWAIKTCGGISVVQDPADAAHPDMPRNALQQSDVDYCVPAHDMAALMQRLVQESIDPGQLDAPSPTMKAEVEIASTERHSHIDDMGAFGKLSAFTCPTCHGALWELTEGNRLRYRCHTGHAFSGESLIGEQTENAEEALYSAMRVMEEKSTALRRIKESWEGRFPQMEADYEKRAADIDASVQVLQRLLARGEA